MIAVPPGHRLKVLRLIQFMAELNKKIHSGMAVKKDLKIILMKMAGEGG